MEEDNNNRLAVEKQSAQASFCKFNCDSGSDADTDSNSREEEEEDRGREGGRVCGR